jgi:type I restriction-modification system DNA methylase subunit
MEGEGKALANTNTDRTNGGANLGFERELWRAADALRNNMDAAEYKHVVLGLIFLKYISDAFAEQHAKLEAEHDQGADPEDPDEYRAVNIFWVPKEARWSSLKANAKQPTIGKLVDDAMVAIENDNPSLKGVLLKDRARPGLDKQRLGQLIDLVGNIGLGDKANRSKDILGRVYEYFLSQFASAEGKKGGQFYTPRCDEDIRKIADTYHAWRGDKASVRLERVEGRMKYQDIPGFCQSATLDDIRKHGHVLTPGRYVGAEAAEEDDEPFEEKIRRLTATLRQQVEEGRKLDAAIAANLKELGYGL